MTVTADRISGGMPMVRTGDLDALRAFRAWQRDRNLSAETIRGYGKLHRAYALWLEEQGSTLARATREDVEDFLALRSLGPKGRYTYLSRLATLYAWLIAEGLADADPTVRIARPILPEGVPRPIATVDLDIAIRTAAPRTRCFYMLAAFAGLRCKEIAGVRAEDLLWNADPAVLVVTSPKGKRERVVPLHPDVTTGLRLFGVPRSGYVFPYWNDPHRAIQPYTVSYEGNRHLHGLGIAETMHSLRAWFATHLYRLGHDIRMVQQLLGHRSPATTAVYTAIVATEAAEAISRLTT